MTTRIVKSAATRPRTVLTFDQIDDVAELLHRTNSHLPDVERQFWSRAQAIGIADVLRNGLPEIDGAAAAEMPVAPKRRWRLWR